MKMLGRYLLFDLRMFWREPMATLFTFVMPAAFYLAAGFAARAQPGGFTANYSPAFTGIVIIIVTLFTVGPSLVLGRELGFYKRLLATPLDTSVILISSMVRAYIVVLAGLVKISVLGLIFFDQHMNWHFWQFMLVLIFCCASMFSGGVLLGSIFKSTRTAFAVSVMLLQPMLFLSGATMPLDKAPEAVKTISSFLPTTYMIDMLRLGWNGDLFTAAAVTPFLVLLIFGAVCGLAAHRLFRLVTL